MLGPLIQRIEVTAPKGRRRLIAIAGPPASGKSTLAERLSFQLKNSVVVPMDGFHLENAILQRRGLLRRKGAPETFDLEGFTQLIRRLAVAREVTFPIFDRVADRAVAAGGVVTAACDTVLVEGNYLMFDAPGWRDLSPIWDLSIRLTLSEQTLERRLQARWTGLGFSDLDAMRKISCNDLPNAQRVAACKLPCDVTLSETDIQKQ
ncbi:nucleoside/nucleotide kinase family protein [Thalassococcus sp. S3]|nr:nucleoside/nucleotide kinase family protein [Thalassococcus sp. S3]